MENTAASSNKIAGTEAEENCPVADRRKFEETARKNMQRLYAHAAVITGSKQDAEDGEAMYIDLRLTGTAKADIQKYADLAGIYPLLPG